MSICLVPVKKFRKPLRSLAPSLVFSALRPLCLVVVLLYSVASAYAQEGEGVTVEIGHSAGNAGETVELPVDFFRGIHQPATMVLWIGYDPARLTPVEDYFETIVRDDQGNPVRDDEGHVMTTRSGVRADFSLEDTGKMLTVAYHPAEGAIAISIAGLGTDQAAIPEGPLLTLAFRIDPSLSVGPTLDVVGHDTNNPVVVDGAERRSSASDTEGPIVLAMRDGGILVGCSAPDLPENVTASQGRSDGILIAWDAVDSPGVTYRVYRADTDDLEVALPLGEGWVEATDFLDITANPADSMAPGGCNGAPPADGPTYYYWVASRTPVGCEQPPSGVAASGFRRGGKTLLTAGFGGLGEVVFGAVLLVLAWLSPAWVCRRKRHA